MLLIMKTLTNLLVIFIFSKGVSQNFKPYEIKKLNSFGLEYKSSSQLNESYILDFNSILIKDRKIRTNRTVGIVLTSLGALSLSSGILILANKSKNGEGRAIQETVGGMFIGAGVINFGISIPLFNASRKRIKERDKLIEKYTRKITSDNN